MLGHHPLRWYVTLLICSRSHVFLKKILNSEIITAKYLITTDGVELKF